MGEAIIDLCIKINPHLTFCLDVSDYLNRNPAAAWPEFTEEEKANCYSRGELWELKWFSLQKREWLHVFSDSGEGLMAKALQVIEGGTAGYPHEG